MNIIVTGGAGYIGSHTVQHLTEKGHEVWVLDNISRGQAAWMNTPRHITGDIQDIDLVSNLLTTHHIKAVIHFAAYAYVGESVIHPLLYYHNNVEGSRCLLEAITQSPSVDYLVFSSTCATYGLPVQLPIHEGHPTQPITPYGRSKKMVEEIIADTAKAHHFKYVILRYFNAAGAALNGKHGECHDPEPHLIPSIIKAAMAHQPVTIHGTDYPTPDGTCIRDYIHVDDLASAHRLALDYLTDNQHPSDIFNLGTGHGYSVQQIIDTCQAIMNTPINTINGPRRDGDPHQLVADARKANQQLGWHPQHSDLNTIINTAWRWHAAHS